MLDIHKYKKLDDGAGNRWDMRPSLIPAIVLKRILYQIYHESDLNAVYQSKQ